MCTQPITGIRLYLRRTLVRSAQYSAGAPCSISLAKSRLSRGKSRLISSLRRMSGADLGHGVAVGIDFAQGLQPDIEHRGHQALVDFFLAREIVEQVRLAHPGSLGDLVDGRATEAFAGEDVERRLEGTHILLFALDAGLRPGRRRLPRWLFATPACASALQRYRRVPWGPVLPHPCLPLRYQHFHLDRRHGSDNVFSNWSNFWITLSKGQAQNRADGPTQQKRLQGSPRGVQPSQRHAERSQRLLDAVHREPAIQGSTAHVLRRQGHALHHVGRPPGPRRHRGPVVRECRPLPPQDRRGDPGAGGRSITRRPSRWDIRRRSSWPMRWCDCARGAGPRVLHQFRLGIGGDRTEDGARLSPGAGRWHDASA